MRDGVPGAWKRRWRAVPAGVVDVGVALVVLAATLPVSIGRAGRDRLGWCLVLALATSVPLVWRRRSPSNVALLTGLGTVAQSILGLLPDIPYGQLVATYTVAALSGRPARLVVGVGTAVGMTVSILAPGQPLVALWYNAAVFVTAYTLGAGARSRRGRIALLEERNRSERAAAAAAERARIARDMHDVLAHSVGLMVVQAEGGAAVVRLDPDRAEAAFDAVAETGRGALAQLRRTIGVLREGPGDREPVAGLARIPHLIDLARRSGLEVSYAEAGAPRSLLTEASVAAYHVVQEALTNVIKHAGAGRAEVALDWRDQALVVRVRDDGTGRPGRRPGAAGRPSDQLAATGAGYGLVGMHARVAGCGGELATGPRAGGHGFEVVATLPVLTGPPSDTEPPRSDIEPPRSDTEPRRGDAGASR